jgi:hypothetical protein
MPVARGGCFVDTQRILDWINMEDPNHMASHVTAIRTLILLYIVLYLLAYSIQTVKKQRQQH